MCSLVMVDINDNMYSSHWYVAVICHAGLFEATSNRSTLTLNDSSSDVISGVLDDTPSTVTSPQVYDNNDSSIESSGGIGTLDDLPSAVTNPQLTI